MTEAVAVISPPTLPLPQNPLLGLLAASASATLYLLQGFSYLVSFVTLTIPRYALVIVGYTFTLHLNFPILLLLTLLVPAVIIAVARYRFLNRYTELKEAPLEKKDTTALHPDVLEDASNPIHNYLDEFLSAIRIFGFLEKPVFHELSRHLQTRRLIAGDSLVLDSSDKSFYCVVDGHVQVYAPSSPSGTGHESYDSEDLNGYSLLTEVSSGGTLSSLFTILNLFTEDVKLAWNETREDDGYGDETDSQDVPTGVRRFKKRADSDVSQLDLHIDECIESSVVSTPGTSSNASSGPSSPAFMARQQSNHLRSQSQLSNRTSSTSTATMVPSPSQRPTFPIHTSQPLSPVFNEVGTPGTSHSQTSSSVRGRTGTNGAQSKGNNKKQKKSEEKGSVARATVDTTLAVIPADAFRRLTRKFPKASAHIVQVILTRFSRVTFRTAHQYLGLTKEVLRAESSLNSFVSEPLPAEFYEGGGMEALRDRFRPQTKKGPTPSGTEVESDEEVDYFSLSNGIRSPSTSSSAARTPSAKISIPLLSMTKVESNPLPRLQQSSPHAASPTPGLKRMNTMKQVQAGDLMVAQPGVFDPVYRPHSAQTPKINRWDRNTSSSFKRPNIFTSSPEPMRGRSVNDHQDFDLREAVMSCLAKSIGLVPPEQLLPTDSLMSPSGSPSPNIFMPKKSQSVASNNGFNQLGFGGLSMLNRNADVDDGSSTGLGSVLTFGAEAELENEIEILFFAQGSTLVKEGEKEAGLFFVIDGFLDISIPDTRPPSKEDERPASVRQPSAKTPFQGRPAFRGPDTPVEPLQQSSTFLYTVKPGGIAGYLSALSSAASYVDIKAKTDVYVGFLTAEALERLLERRPIVLLTLAKRLISLLSPLVLHIDASLDWMQVDAGQVLYRQGDSSDSIHIVINGRLRAVRETDGGGVDVVAEYGQGESVGELEAITGDIRPYTIHAIRDTEIARMPLTLFNAIATRHPSTTIQFLRSIASRVTRAVNADVRRALPAPGALEVTPSNFNLKTVCILPCTRNVPVVAFAQKLRTALEDIGAPTSYLDQATVLRKLGRHTFSPMGKLKVAGWLAEQEQQYRIVIYVADTAVSSQWTVTCIKQSDFIFCVGMGDDPAIGEYEKLLLAKKTTARKELVLLHPDRNVATGSTRPWLKNRPWIAQHHHVELAGIVLPAKSGSATGHDPAAIQAFKSLQDKVTTRIRRFRGLRPIARAQRPAHMNDFARLARRLCGASVGVVLGGGGGRGIAHIGLLQTMEDQGVPVDMIGGCSIGAFVGGLYARDGDLLSLVGRTKQFSGRMASMWRILSDVTWPTVSYTTGHEFNRGIYKAFNDVHIEDMWLPFFCVSTSILYSRMEVHTTGYAWRYVRASMTLAGLLPPLSDNGNMLVDGGYIDNLPVATMVALGAARIIACDVGAVDDTTKRNYGDSVSGLWVAINRYNPFSNARNIPTITDVTGRLTYVSSVRTLEEAKATPGVLYHAMPVQQFSTLGGFGQFDEILKIGLDSASEEFKQWRADGKLPTGLLSSVKLDKAKRRGTALRRNSV